MIFNMGGVTMKRKFFLFFFLLSIFLCSCESDYSNFDVKINFTPSEYYNAEIRCVEKILPYYRGDFIEKLRHARKVKPSFVSESKTEEGQYQILLYKGEVCVGNYKVCGEDYLFDNQYDSFLECNNILNDVRAIFYMQIMINNMDIPIEIPKN